MYRYIGNKTAILGPLLEILCRDANDRTVFADLMTGTGAVAQGLAEHGHNVVAADILTFPTFHASVRLRMPQAPEFRGLGMTYSEVLDDLNKSAGRPGFYWQEYSPEGRPKNGSQPRKYLSPSNAMLLDQIDSKIAGWLDSQAITDAENALLRHDLILAVNRIANIAGTYGHFRATFSKASLAPLEIRPSVFNPWASEANTVIRGPVEELAKTAKADFLYLDPPYKKRQYAANYHLLETIALGDHPEPVGKSGLRDWWPEYSDFCSKRKIGSAFEAVLENDSFERVFVSYSEDGLLNEVQMFNLLSDFGKVKVHGFSHKRFKSNASTLGPSLRELVFEIEPR